MASKWIKKTMESDDAKGKSSFRHIARSMDDHDEPDADDAPSSKRKRKSGGIVAAMNEPEAY